MNNGNQIIVATAVLGGLLVGSPDAMAQQTYNGGSTSITTTTSSTGTTTTTVVATPTVGSNSVITTTATPVSTTAQVTVQAPVNVVVTQPIQTTTNATATLSTSSSTSVSNVTVGQNSAGAITATVPQGNTVSVASNNTAPVVSTASTSTGTSAVVTVPVGNTGTVSVTPSATSNNVVIASSGTTASSVNVSSTSAPLSFTTSNTTTPVVLTGNNTTSSTITVSSGAVTMASNSTTSAPAGITVANGATLGTGGTITNTPITSTGGSLRTGNAPTFTLFTGVNTVVKLSNTDNGGLQADIDGTVAASAATNGGPGKYGVFDLQNNASIALTGPIDPTLGGDAFNVAGDPASSGYKNPAVGTGYAIITTSDGTGGISGAFTGIGKVGVKDLTGATGTTPASMLRNTTFDVVYNPKSVVLYVTPSRYQDLSSSGVSLSSNQTASATALQAIRMANRPLGVERLANGDLKSLFDNLAPQSAAGLQDVYDQISGASIASMAESSVRTADLFSDTFTARARHGRNMAQTGMSGGDRGRSVVGWAQPIGQIGGVDTDGNGPGFDSSTYGAVAGLEATMNNSVLGLGFGYGRESIDSKSYGNKATADNYVFGVYGEYAPGPAFVNGTIGYTWKRYEETRNLSFGSYSRTATGAADGNTFNVAGNVGYTFTPNAYIIEPTLGLHYTNFSLASFNETGAGALSLRVGKQDYDSLQSVLAVRIAKPVVTEGGMKVVPELSIGWGHELLSNKASITSTFAGGKNAFTVAGARPGDDAALLGLGVKAQLNDRFDIFADYNGRFSGGSTQNSFGLGLKYKFN